MPILLAIVFIFMLITSIGANYDRGYQHGVTDTFELIKTEYSCVALEVENGE